MYVYVSMCVAYPPTDPFIFPAMGCLEEIIALPRGGIDCCKSHL